MNTGQPTRFSEAGDQAACFTLFREAFDAPVVARFTIEGEPVSKSRARFTKRGSKTRTYTPEKTRQAEEKVAWLFRQAARGHKPDPDSTYGVMALFFAGTRQRRDVDNMLKLILDGLNKVAWADDDQVVEVSGRKSFENRAPKHPRTEVVVYRVGTVYRPTATCEHCGEEYISYASWRNQRRFCSRECGYAWRRAQRKTSCGNCGKEFVGGKPSQPAKYCGRECAYAAKRITVTCTGCGSQFTKQRCYVRKTNYCSDDCRSSHWREQRKTAAKGTCSSCGGPTSKKAYQMCRPCRLKARAS